MAIEAGGRACAVEFGRNRPTSESNRRVDLFH